MSEKVREGVVRSLHIRSNHYNINLGNWRDNLCYGFHVMSGGEQSFSEIRRFFNASVKIEDTGQAIVYVESYETARYIAEELRKHYKLTGEEASDLIPYYHLILDEETKRRIVRRF
ncbi:hypothetical protein FRC12_023363 [Ceratobasidium sp. 428]|nr:hypothetical protein FRC12_023363 [Ceratobasidium sp. 428]